MALKPMVAMFCYTTGTNCALQGHIYIGATFPSGLHVLLSHFQE